MVLKILILIFFFEIKESKITRGHNYKLVKKQSRLDVRKYSFSQRTINVWNNLSTDCVHAFYLCLHYHFGEMINCSRIKYTSFFTSPRGFLPRGVMSGHTWPNSNKIVFSIPSKS